MRLIEEGVERGYKYFDFPSAFRYEEDRSTAGLLLLSKYPIIDSDFKLFLDSSEASSTRGAQYAKIKVTDEYNLQVFHIHFQSTSTSWD